MKEPNGRMDVLNMSDTDTNTNTFTDTAIYIYIYIVCRIVLRVVKFYFMNL